MLQAFPETLGRVLERIETAALRSGRGRNDITLVAVTKTVPLERVLPFLHGGVRDFGENRVQEALSKFQGSEQMPKAHSIFHLIGQLQTNKAKKAVEFFDMIQSVDRWELAETLNVQAKRIQKKLNCLVEVKISSEASKSGVHPDQLNVFLSRLKELTSLSVRGLMGIAPQEATGDTARPFFSRLRKLADDASLPVVSMGMSGDFEAAIAEGSTMVRIGSALFGSRA